MESSSISLANLCFLGPWAELLDIVSRNAFTVFNRFTFEAMMLDVLLLSVVFWVTITLARRASSTLPLKLLGWGLPVLLLLPLSAGATMLYPDLSALNLVKVLKLGYFNQTELLVIGSVLAFGAAAALARRFKIVVGVLAAILLYAAGRPEPVWLALFISIPVALAYVRWQPKITRVASTLVLVLAPFVLITFSQAVRNSGAFTDKPPAQLVRSEVARPRVVWMLFDELDQGITFAKRHPSLNLPELDRFREQAIYASNVYPPSDSTVMSLPAMITGRLIAKAKVAGPSELFITYAGTDKPVAWSNEPNLFSAAREHGVNSGVIGWYHPYCRILGHNLAFCSFTDMGRAPFTRGMTEQFKSMARSIPMTSYYRVFDDRDPEQVDRRRRFKEAYLGILAQAHKATVNPDLGLLLVHWPIPHPPAIFNQFTREFELGSQSGYLGNLVLVDRTLGEVRRTMEEAGVWENSVVLITADHWFRREIHFRTREDDEALALIRDHRVPFLLKLPGQQQGVNYDREFNNVLIHDLLLAIIRGELKTERDVLAWLDRNRSIGESPYNYERAR